MTNTLHDLVRAIDTAIVAAKNRSSEAMALRDDASDNLIIGTIDGIERHLEDALTMARSMKALRRTLLVNQIK